MTDQRSEEILEFFKAMADANRLRIIGLLATQEYSGEQLAAILDLRTSTVSHHLSMLAHAGIVSSRGDSYYRIYFLDEDAFNNRVCGLLSSEEISKAFLEDLDLDAYDRKVLETFLRDDGTIRQLPKQVKKLEAILRYIMREFEPGRQYTEKEVNEVIGGLNADISGLRRDLIDFKMLARDKRGSAYWVVE